MFRLLLLLSLLYAGGQGWAQPDVAKPHLWRGDLNRALDYFSGTDTEQQIWRCLLQLESRQPKQAYQALFAAERASSSASPLLDLGIGHYHAYYREWRLALPALCKAERQSSQLPEFAQLLLHKSLGSYYRQRQQAEKALGHYQKASELMSRQPDNWQDYDELGELKMTVGELHDQLLEPDEAVENYRNILERKDQLLREHPERAGQLYLRIGRVYFRQKDYEVAAPYLEEALNYNLSSDEKANAESMLARILASREAYDDAIERSSTALEDWGKQAPPKQFQELLQFGDLCQAVETPEQTRSCYQKTIEGEVELSSELQNYAQEPVRHLLDPKRSENFNYALLAFERAKRLIKKLPKVQQPVASIEVQMSKGKLFFNTKNFKKARYHYDTALDLMKPIYEEKHPLRAEAYRMLSEIYLEEELYGDALQFVDKAIESSMQEGGSGLQWKKAAFPYELLYAIGTKGTILREVYSSNPNINDLKQSLEAFEAALEMIYHLRRTYHGDGAKYKLAELTQRFSLQALRSCLLLYEQSQDEQYAARAFDFTEAAKGTLLLENVRALRARQIAGIPQALSQFDLQLKQRMAYVDGEIFYELKRGKDKDFSRLSDLRNTAQQLRGSHDSLVQVIQKEYPSYFKLKYDYSTISLSDLQKQLQAEEAILQYNVLDSSICLFVIKPQSWKIIQVPIPQANLLRKVSQLLLGLDSKEGFIDFRKAAYDLYKLLLFDAIPELEEEQTLIVLPDGELHYVPFEILLSSYEQEANLGELPYLLRDYALCYHYTGTLFAESRKKGNPAPQAFGAFAPDFELVKAFLAEHDSLNARYGSFDLTPLPGALAEVQGLGKLLKGAAFTSAQASESLFWEQAKQFSVLHLATHAILNDKSPLYSGLALQGGAGEDGLVHAYELYNHYLPADLVTLSACNSGLGTFQKGEGSMSLAHAFSFAGARNVVMSLWPVEDASTKVLMTYFYDYLSQGLPKALALQKAKLLFLERHPKQAHPLYWSPFLVVGNPDTVPALKQAQGFNYLYLLLLLAFLALGVFLFWRWKRAPSKQTTTHATALQNEAAPPADDDE